MVQTIKPLCLLIGILAIGLLFSCGKDGDVTPDNTNSTSPNIVLIIADGVGWDAFGSYPGTTGAKAMNNP